MKRLALNIIPIAAMTCGILCAQDISGTWQGTLHSGGDLRTVFKVSKDGSGALKAMYYSIDQPGPGIAVSAVTVQGATVKFAIPAIGATYEGKLAGTGGTEIKGSWSQDAKPEALDLTRANSATAWEIPEQVAPKTMAEDARPQFEVATIKPSQPGNFGSFSVSRSGVLSVASMPVSVLIGICYNLNHSQVIGGPSWLETDKFDITAKPDTQGYPGKKQLNDMLQKLLEDRFRFAFHHETKELPAYALTLAKAGPKLTESADDPNVRPTLSQRGTNELSVRNATMAEFASYLQGDVLGEQPVVDQTGLGSKRYDFELKFTPEVAAADGATGAQPAAVNPDEPPDIYVAIQKQLGLKIESTKALVDVMVIDRVEKPSAN